jgi:hypothetical protein
MVKSATRLLTPTVKARIRVVKSTVRVSESGRGRGNPSSGARLPFSTRRWIRKRFPSVVDSNQRAPSRLRRAIRYFDGATYRST